MVHSVIAMNFFTKLPRPRGTTAFETGSRTHRSRTNDGNAPTHQQHPQRVSGAHAQLRQTVPAPRDSLVDVRLLVVAFIAVVVATSCERTRAPTTIMPGKFPELSFAPPPWSVDLLESRQPARLHIDPPPGETATLTSAEIVTMEVQGREPFQSLAERTVDLQFLSPENKTTPDSQLQIVNSQITTVPVVGDWVERLGHLLTGAELRGFYPTEGMPFQAVNVVPAALSADLAHVSLVAAMMFACFSSKTWNVGEFAGLQRSYAPDASLDALSVSCRSRLTGYAPCSIGKCPVYAADFQTASFVPPGSVENGVTAQGTGTGTAWILVFPDGRVPLEGKLVYNMSHRLNSSQDEATPVEITQTRRAVVTWRRTTVRP